MHYFNTQEMLHFLMELTLALLLGGVIGFEREKHGQGAGFRTNILICMSACLLMQLSLNMEAIFRHLDQSSAVRVDPGRIASYAIAGMGFIGAGAIIKGGGTIRGLTTAASMWLVTGVGLSVGAGFYFPAIITVLFAMLVLYGLRGFKTRFLKEFHIDIILKVDSRVCDFRCIEKVLGQFKNTSIEFVNFRRDIVKNTALYNLKIISKGDEEWRIIARELRTTKGVNEITWTDGSML